MQILSLASQAPSTQGSIRVLNIHQVIPRVTVTPSPCCQTFYGGASPRKYEYNCQSLGVSEQRAFMVQEAFLLTKKYWNGLWLAKPKVLSNR